MRSPKKALDDIENAKSIAIFCHTNPDADALASCVSIKKLIKLNLVNSDETKVIDIFFEYEDISELNNAIIKGVETNIQNCEKYDIAICVDCPTADRMGKYKDLFLSTENTINFDHHATNEEFAYNNLVLKKASSTCEVLYTLAKIQNLHISDEFCKLIYAGIITDTCNLTQGTITVRTHKIITELVERGIDIDSINDHFFKNNTKSKAYLLKEALDSLAFYANDRIAFMKLTKQDLQECNATFDDTLGIVNQGIEIKGVDIAILAIKQEDNSYYVSLRGKNEVEVANIAKNMGGGGHEQVAAFQYSGFLTDLRDALLSECKIELAKHPAQEIGENLFAGDDEE